MEIYTIGFAGRPAESFFLSLRERNVRRLVDVRLRNVSQLAAYTKRDDLAFFLGELCKASYSHELLLAPTNELLDDYRKRRIDWPAYEEAFCRLLRERKVESVLRRDDFLVATVLLCSEFKADHCHRRLVAEYLKARWGDVDIVHL